MKKISIRAGLLAAAFLAAQSGLFTGVSAAEDSDGYTRLITSGNHDCYADINIVGNHFTIEGRVAIDPIIKVRFSTDDVEMTDYMFIELDDNAFYAEFDAEFSGDWCELWFVKESRLVLNYRIHHDERGWYFPDNGLDKLNAEKLENILTAPPEASAYYISQTADPVEIEETLGSLERIVQEVCGDEEDDYMKALLLYRWISDNFYYDSDAADAGVTLDTIAIHNVLERQRTTCAGFANTYCALLEIAGIRSVNLKGSAVAVGVTYEELLNGVENHEFTAFWYEAENRWVYADPTWGTNGKYRDGEYVCDYPSTEKYFDETGESFSLRHRIDKVEERNYLGVLNSDEETTAEPSDTEGSQTTEKNETTTSTTAHSPTAPQSSEASQNGGNFVIYIVIGAAGVVVVIIGIILAARKKK